MSPRAWRPSAWLAGATLLGVLAACGQKGPPRPPVRVLPGGIATPAITRMVDRVYVMFRVPAADSDGTAPGDIVRVELYGMTTQPTDERPTEPFSDEWLDAATLVASLPVRPPGAAAVPGAATQSPGDGPRLASDRPEPVDDGVVGQGDLVTVVERLTADRLIPVTLDDDDDDDDDDDADDDAPDRVIAMPYVSPPLPRPPIRSYVAFAVSSRRREGAPSPMVAVPLVAPPEAPGPVRLSYTDQSVTMTWDAPARFRRSVQPEDTPDTWLPSTSVFDSGLASEYVVFDLVAGGDPDRVRPPALGPPLAAGEYLGAEVTFGSTACYAVRTLEHVDETLAVYSDASPATCVVFTDTFAPTAPTGLDGIADAGAISLVWNDNVEPDIAGYVVLRGAASDATLQPLTPTPIDGTTYRDGDVVSGERYRYQIIAVDTAVPPNRSLPSAAIVESAR